MSSGSSSDSSDDDDTSTGLELTCSGPHWKLYFGWLQKVAIITSTGKIIENAKVDMYGRAFISHSQTPYDISGRLDEHGSVGILMATYKQLKQNPLFKHIPSKILYEELNNKFHKKNKNGYGGPVDKYHDEQSIDLCCLKPNTRCRTPFLGSINGTKEDIRFYINPYIKKGKANKNRISALSDIFLHRIYDKMRHSP